MKKYLWLKVNGKNKQLIAAAIECGFAAVVTESMPQKEIQKMGRIKVVSEKGDIRLGTDVLQIRIKTKEDEKRAAKAKVPVIVENSSWTIIPLENLIAAGAQVIQTVKNKKEACLALSTMECGAAGICLEATRIKDIKEVAEVFFASNQEKITLKRAVITRVADAGMADRVCVDTTSILAKGSGALVGDSSSGMVLIHNENIENEFVAARPFRVNAGAVHAYYKKPNGLTGYLSEAKKGSEVLVVNHKGEGVPVVVGRAKVERRPMLAISAKTKEGDTASVVLQNAETVRLVTPRGGHISVAELKKGTAVLVAIEAAGRHFGMKIKESIQEQ